MNPPKPPQGTNPPPGRRDPILRALSAATARVRAADRALAAVLHPSVSGVLSEDQRAAIADARQQVRAIPADLRAAAVEHTTQVRPPNPLPPNVVPLFKGPVPV